MATYDAAGANVLEAPASDLCEPEPFPLPAAAHREWKMASYNPHTREFESN